MTRDSEPFRLKCQLASRVKEPGETPSRWLAASRDHATIDALVAAGWQVVTPGERPFTDDYADLLSYLQLGR